MSLDDNICPYFTFSFKIIDNFLEVRDPIWPVIIPITLNEANVVAQIDGHHSIAFLKEQARDIDIDIIYLLYRLASIGAIIIPGVNSSPLTFHTSNDYKRLRQWVEYKQTVVTKNPTYPLIRTYAGGDLGLPTICERKIGKISSTRDALSIQKLEDGAIIYDITNRFIHYLNEAAYHLWNNDKNDYEGNYHYVESVLSWMTMVGLLPITTHDNK